MTTETFDYRLIEKEYKNRIENEDGPGSLQNIVSDTRTRVVEKWYQEDSSFGDSVLAGNVYGLRLEEDSADGYYEFAYFLERKRCDEEEWRYVGHLDREQIKRSEWDAYTDYDSREEDLIPEWDNEPNRCALCDTEVEECEALCSTCETEIAEEIEEQENQRRKWDEEDHVAMWKDWLVHCFFSFKIHRLYWWKNLYSVVFEWLLPSCIARLRSFFSN